MEHDIYCAVQVGHVLGNEELAEFPLYKLFNTYEEMSHQNYCWNFKQGICTSVCKITCLFKGRVDGLGSCYTQTSDAAQKLILKTQSLIKVIECQIDPLNLRNFTEAYKGHVRKD
jgi:hypothetical protein